MNKILLKLRLTYNRWYLGQLQRSALTPANQQAQLITDQMILIRRLERIIRHKQSKHHHK